MAPLAQGQGECFGPDDFAKLNVSIIFQLPVAPLPAYDSKQHS